MRGDVLCDQARHSGLRLAHHHHVDLHRLERVHGVEDGFALAPRGEVHFEIHDVGAEAAGGELEGAARARARLAEQIGDRDAGQRSGAHRRSAQRPDELLRALEEPFDHGSIESLERDEVLQGSVVA